MKRTLMALLLVSLATITVNAQDTRERWTECLRVFSPAPCSEVTGQVKVKLQAKGMEHVVARCYVSRSKGKPKELVLTPKGIKLDRKGMGTFNLPAKKLPYGPLTV